MSRYKAQLLLDEASSLACAAYVDLNSMRAAIAKSIDTSKFTGVKDRIDDLKERKGKAAVGTSAGGRQAGKPNVRAWEWS